MNIKAVRNGAPILALLVVFFVGWYVGLPAKQETSSEGGGTLWTCSMHPQVRQPNPGLCPICEMELIELAPGGESGLREIEVTPEAAALMDLRVSPVVRQPATVEVDLFGKIAYDERNVNTTTARMGGRLDRFYVDFTGTVVRKDDHIAEIYSPALFVAQENLIKATKGIANARRTGTTGAVETQQRLLKSARNRLRLLQLSNEQIDAIAAQSEPTDHITLFAPQDGVVTKRHVVEGAYVKTGDPLFAVANLKSVWLNLEAYESDLRWVRYAQEVTFTVEAIPGEVFYGRVAHIDRELDALRRVMKVRVNVDNPEGLLKPGMFARAMVKAEVAKDGSVIDAGLAGKWISPMHPEVVSDNPGKCRICGMDLVPAEELGFIAKPGGEHGNPLLVPASAVMRTGTRAVVYVRLKGAPVPVFEGREIVLGARVGDQFIVDSGLSEGEMVVTRGAFKLDSELQLKARPSLMGRNSGLVETPAADAEESLLAQWGPVPRALGRLRSAAERGDEAAAHAAIARMEAALEQVHSDKFHPKTLTDWKEFSGRVKNALVLAHRNDATQLAITYRDIRTAVEESGRYLGLPFQPVDEKPVEDAEQLAALKESLDAYYAVAKALAADDEAAALAAIPELAAGLDEKAEPLRAARNIEQIREAFRPVSDHLIARVKEGGMDHVGNAYVVHCPMVKDNQGGDWLSRSPMVVNPYFGDAMLNCGTVTGNLSFEPSASDRDRSRTAK